MARAERTLTARGVSAITAPGRYSDGGGLYLFVSADGNRRWIWQYQWTGKTREMGLGSAEIVGLKEARDDRDKWRAVLQGGQDPITVRKAGKVEATGAPTFGAVADDFLKAKAGEWKNAKHKAQWKMTLEVHAAPIRPLQVDKITTADIVGVLKPIWESIPETASRLRGRIEKVLDAARSNGHIDESRANPARWAGHLVNLLPKRRKLSRGHHAALPYIEVTKFMAKLRKRSGASAMALEFTILTAARSNETFGATWAEIDLKNKIWTVPAERMKMERPHRVPLSEPAVSLLEQLKEQYDSEFLFPGSINKGRPLSGMAMEMVLRRMGIKKGEATVHGFRSSFRDWAGDMTSFDREVAEAALSHIVGDKAEQAYRRGDALKKRRDLMDLWAQYCGEPRPAKVIEFPKKAAG